MSTINVQVETSGQALPRGGVRKRAFDLCIALILTFAFLPAMFFIGLILLAIEGGPVFFEHERIGYRGRRFRCLKFRSMSPNAKDALAQYLDRNPAARAEWASTQKLKNDPRVTPFGRFLRESSLDELPQLINVIRGEMSLVGPRPVVEVELARYCGDRIHYESARPGITGLWQVSGRSDVDYDRRVMLDASYVENWTFLGDLIILIRTLKVVFLRTGSY